SSVVTPVALAHDEFIPPNGSKPDRPLIILHGFFGSKRNWQSLAKAFMKDLGRPVYTLDLRNHGSSPHTRPMTYTHMASDVLNFCETRSLTKVSLLGHSMGGKVAMSLALNPNLPPGFLADLIVSDIAPVRASIAADTVRHIEAMERIEASGVSTRKEADAILAEYENDPSVRAFLLTNLDNTSRSSHLKFKVPLDILKEGRPHIESFPYAPGERIWEGHTLFVKGTRSSFINHKNIPFIRQCFPNTSLEELDTGHWVHAERPNEFKTLVTHFITP
ncbi:alpha/beta-hydrolase, partial [Leucogyrophana mollusca]